MTGYILENLLGFTLGVAVYILRRRQQGQQSGDSKIINRCASVVRRGCHRFYDCAIFLTFSTQLASIVVLARLDFGISASGMGDSTAKITWAVSLLTILPLTYIAFNPDLLRDPVTQRHSSPKSQESKDRREQLRFLLFAICWMLFVYPFLSRMMETFGPSMIGGDDQVISTSDWDIVAAVCTANVDAITNKETLAMKFFSVVGSVFICVLAIIRIIWLSMVRQHKESRLVHHIRDRWLQKSRLKAQIPIVLFIAVPLIAISQLWTIFRLRSFQNAIAQASDNQDIDSQWTFGQIAAVTIFVPVAVECWFSWLYD